MLPLHDMMQANMVTPSPRRVYPTPALSTAARMCGFHFYHAATLSISLSIFRVYVIDDRFPIPDSVGRERPKIEFFGFQIPDQIPGGKRATKDAESSRRDSPIPTAEGREPPKIEFFGFTD